MTLTQQIDSDYIKAYKNKEELKVSVLRLLKASIKNLSIEKKGQLSDENVISVISREIKQRKEVIVQYEKGGRTDLAQKEKNEIDILSGYLPEQMSEDELKNVVFQTLSDKGYTLEQTGRAIGEVMSQVKGKADGSTVSRLVNEYLSSN